MNDVVLVRDGKEVPKPNKIRRLSAKKDFMPSTAATTEAFDDSCVIIGVVEPVVDLSKEDEDDNDIQIGKF